MTTQVHRCMIAPSEQAPLARQICAALAPSGGSDMFSVGLSPTGQAPATHYVSTGYIDAEFAALMPLDGEGGQPASVAALCQQAGLTVSEAEVAALFAQADVTAEEPFAAFGRLGLQMIQETG